jgi:NAD(P)H dehydrogenase (quinone)
MQQVKQKILILYYSRTGAVKKMARLIANGVEAAGLDAVLRTVPPVSPGFDDKQPQTPDAGAPYASMEDLTSAAGIIVGSPTRFGNMAAPLKYFIDQTSALWTSGALIDKPISCFTSTSSLHGGQESTLLSMMLPFLHHGALIMGVPYSETTLLTTATGGTPYGASHVSGHQNAPISADEKQVCITQGKRMAEIVMRLQEN